MAVDEVTFSGGEISVEVVRSERDQPAEKDQSDHPLDKIWAESLVRASVRNQLRGHIERSRFLSQIFGKEYVPEVSSDDIEAGIRKSRESLVKVIEQVADPSEKLLAEARVALFDVEADFEELKSEEYLKYFAFKFDAALKKSDYMGARKMMDSDSRLSRITREMVMNFLKPMVILKVQGLVEQICEKNDRVFVAELLKCFYCLCCRFEVQRSDLAEIPDEKLRHPAIQKFFREDLSESLEKNVVIYLVTRDLMASAGFIDIEETNQSSQIRDKARSTLFNYLNFFPEAFAAYKKLYIDSGLFDTDEVIDFEEVAKIVLPNIFRLIIINPEIFAWYRDELEKAGIQGLAKIYENPEFQKIVKQKAEACLKKYPHLFAKYRLKCHKAGIEIPDSQEMEAERMRLLRSGKEEWSDFGNDELTEYESHLNELENSRLRRNLLLEAHNLLRNRKKFLKKRMAESAALDNFIKAFPEFLSRLELLLFFTETKKTGCG